MASTLPTDRFYEPELDVLRFFAFLSVFAFHALPSDFSNLVPRLGLFIPHLMQGARDAMALGVCVFFLLSSYLITKLLIIERAKTGVIHFGSFYIRRILRIWTLYIGFLLLMWLLGSPWFHVFPAIEGGRLIAFLLFCGNIYSGIHGFTENPILPLWTVSIEEQFYILWPWFARCDARFLRVTAWLVLAISISSVIALRIYSNNPTLVVWTSSLVQFQFFALGALVALGFAKRLSAVSASCRLVLLISGVALLVGSTLECHVFSAQDTSAVLFTLGYVLTAIGTTLIFLAFRGAGTQRRIPPSLLYLGKISFGLYVFHELALQVSKTIADHFNIHYGFRTIAAAAITFALAALSYRYFERPFLVLKGRFAIVRSRAV